MIDTGFLEDLASAEPVPGGGGASAYCGALAAALSSMVGNLTLGKKKYMDVEAEVMGCIARLSILRSSLVSLIDADAEAFLPLSAAYRLPHSTEEEAHIRKEAIQDGLVDASRVPLRIMECVKDVLCECDYLARNGSVMAVSDAGASALMAKAALVSASLNVYINASSMDDKALAGELTAKAGELIEEGCQMADSIYMHVSEMIGAPT